MERSQRPLGKLGRRRDVSLSLPAEGERKTPRPSVPPAFTEDESLHVPLLSRKNDFEQRSFEAITSERCRWLRCNLVEGSDSTSTKVEVLVAAYTEAQTASSSKASRKIYKYRAGACMCESGGARAVDQVASVDWASWATT